MAEGSTFRFSVGADPLLGADEFADLAARTEGLGLHGLCVSDHPGVTPSPFVRLASVAPITTSLRLIPYVVNCGVRDPVDIANDAATLDSISNGRLVLGLGAGHTPAEWTMTGQRYPSATERVDRFLEVVDAVRRLLAGEVVTTQGKFVTLDQAFQLHPRPAQDPVPLLIGGNGRRLLRRAARVADIISFTGLGITLEDGHRHQALWDGSSIDERVTIVESAGARSPIREVLVQHLELTDDRVGAAERFQRAHPDLKVDSILGSPHVLLGTEDEIVEEILGYRARWGFTSYVVPSSALDAAAELAGALAKVDG